MKNELPRGRYAAFGILASLFAAFLAVLAVRLHEVQTAPLPASAPYREARFKIVETAGVRGRILDRRGRPLAMCRRSLVVRVDPGAFRPRTASGSVVTNIAEAIASLEPVIGRPSLFAGGGAEAIAAKLRRDQIAPLAVWRDLSDEELARFEEQSFRHPGFVCKAEAERFYPGGTLAAHVLGRTSPGDVKTAPDGRRIAYREKEPCGREGLELRYDEYLRSVPGEERLSLDARGSTIRRETAIPAKAGCDLKTTLDIPLQRAVETALAGRKGACVALDPRDGAILACASSPSYDLNECVPSLPEELYAGLRDDPAKPLLNRATAGSYAPGSTFKPVTALAGLSAGWGKQATHLCTGSFLIGGMCIRCGRTWGHGPLDVKGALRESCNPFFCNLGIKAGTNALFTAARKFGLGSRTGVDFPTDAPGLIPSDEWKRAHYGTKWYPGDLAQMSLGQGMLLASPLQMARVAGAIGTGRLVTPRFSDSAAPFSVALDFPESDLETVREGMREVVKRGTGRLAGSGVAADVMGKTGTAEVGAGSSRRKNVWFIAYAVPNEASREKTPLAIALVIENGESGGGTAAPAVGSILKSFYGEET